MKNQTDLIVTIVAVLCMLIGVGVCFGTKKEAVQPAAPEKVVNTPLAMPQANVVMADALPGATGQAGAAPMPAAGGARPGGPSGGFGPPPGAVPGGAGRPGGGSGMFQGSQGAAGGGSGLQGPPAGPPPRAAAGG